MTLSRFTKSRSVTSMLSTEKDNLRISIRRKYGEKEINFKQYNIRPLR